MLLFCSLPLLGFTLFASVLTFQVHFVHVKNDIGVNPEKCHLLADVIQNLELDSSYYMKRTLKVCHS